MAATAFGVNKNQTFCCLSKTAEGFDIFGRLRKINY
jgi:hypothetical protein